ncbi:MAG: mechanosensitive ion channel family protein, partial [Gammaproteobacteria bacterium]
LYSAIKRFIKSPFTAALCKWIGIPVAILQVFGWLGNVTGFLDSLALDLGDIHLTAYALIRLAIFGSVLYWLGHVSSSTGQRVIRQQEALDIGTREIFAKLFHVIVILVVLLLLMQIMGINLTTLAVFGGAVGVGIGLGLQSIASNFIAGIIILMDRSICVGDYVEFEGGQAGTIRELKMRSTTVETFDGKDIVIPNEQFITHSFQNWTHKDTRQRYSLEFSVTYATDLHALFDLLRTVVTSHPQVLGGDNVAEEFQPDAEIAGFSQTGVDILVEYWIDGVDDGELRVKADLMLMIWDIFKTHAIEFAVPARETIKFQNETIKFQQEVIKCLESLNDRYAALQQT